MSELWNNFLYQPILQSLIFLYNITHNFGLAIISLTLITRSLLVPLTLPSLKSAKKMRQIQPEIAKLKNKHKNDKLKLQKAQMELFKKHGVNPAAGCLPQIVQIIVLIAMYRVFINFLNNGVINGEAINTRFLWLDLKHPDPFYVLPVLAAGSQLLLSFMMRPATEHHHLKTEGKKQKKQEEDMASALQSQMLYMMPLMTFVIALRFPSGLALYWVATTIFSLIQQAKISGLGGLKPVLEKINLKV